jgi:hypothetical protein
VAGFFYACSNSAHSQDEPAPSGERLVAAEQAIDIVTSSYAAVEPPLRSFFAALDDRRAQAV